jgi:hypothetical protein
MAFNRQVIINDLIDCDKADGKKVAVEVYHVRSSTWLLSELERRLGDCKPYRLRDFYIG